MAALALRAGRALAAMALLLASLLAVAQGPPVYIGLSLEFGHATSTSDEAIRAGAQVAIDEINRAGGILGGRKLALIERDNRSVPARALADVRELAAREDVVAVYFGKFSPVALESIPLAHKLRLPVLIPWAAADGIVDNGYHPNYVFRLSLRDSWALQRMLEHAEARQLLRVALLLPNSSWGRSSLKAAEAVVASRPRMRIVASQWYNWADASLAPQYRRMREAGAQVLLMVANEQEGGTLVKEVAAMAPPERLPVLSHWGITGGNFFETSRDAIPMVDLRVVQTFSFLDNPGAKVRRVAKAAQEALGARTVEEIASPVGVAHAYDLTHILARAVNLAGTTDRAAVRDALENVRDYDGLVRHYSRPFSPQRHEALSLDEVFLGRFQADGSVRRLPPP